MIFLAIPVDVALPGAVLQVALLGTLALIIIFILIVFVEAVVLQLIGWEDRRAAFKAAFWMNLASTAAGFLLLAFVNRLTGFGLVLAWAVSVIIEGLVLKRSSPRGTRFHWYASLLANLVSYLLLILPAYLLRG